MVNKDKCIYYFEDGDFKRAVDCFDLLLFNDPTNIGLMYWKASSLIQNGDFKDAINVLDDVLKIDEKCVDAIHYKGVALMGLGKLIEAEKYFDKTLEFDSNHILCLYNKGNVLFDSEKYSKAVEYYKKSIELDPNYIDCWFNYGLSLFILGNYSDAKTKFEMTIELDPEFYNGWYFKGNSLELLGDYDEALQSYNKAFRINPDNAYLLSAKGRIYLEYDKIDKSLELFNKSLDLDPENIDALFNKANALNQMDKTELALEFFQKVVKLDPQNEYSWLEMGVINDTQGNEEEALANFKRVNEINPLNELAWYDQGLMFRELKKPKKALKCFEKAIKLVPAYSDAWYSKGNVLRDLQQEEDAIEAYKNYVKIVEEHDISEDKLTARRVKEFIRMSKEGEEVSVSPPEKTQFWQWVTKAEYFLERDGMEREALDPEYGSDPGGYWTCHKDTRVGDLILLYRAGKKDGVTYQDIKYLIQAQSDAYTIDYDEYAFEHGWQYGCDYKPLFKFDNSLSYQELNEDPYLEDWNALRKRFQGIAFKTEERHWKRLQELLEEKNLAYKDFLKSFKPKEVIEVDISEKLVEEELSKNLDVLKKFGFDLKFLGRQVRCIGQGGRIDILCEDKKDGSLVIIELKIVKATRNTFGQISNYVGWAIKRKANGKNVKGLVISKGYDNEFDSAQFTNKDINQIELAEVLDELGMKLK
ncbi:endonuclease NucS domain-containing protein [Methanobacterium ferruginis]|uniref:endonuclease NucS domain-containing protein n=1 Tax=Methanobacterium ferruginis TaxID=710191 RepID=UPI002572C00F|nr:endonuclease NucS domain-containing protein [Methanobacterium ferruginis]BDZ68757.1 hypothetical protein GCM10025860_22050 [Methanobacterium ferruginis]